VKDEERRRAAEEVDRMRALERERISKMKEHEAAFKMQ